MQAKQKKSPCARKTKNKKRQIIQKNKKLIISQVLSYTKKTMSEGKSHCAEAIQAQLKA